MNARLPSPAPFPGRRRPRAGFTLVEVMVAATLTLVLLVAVLGAVVALQKSYVATENFATGLADQMRLLDYLALDLRRAVSPGTGVSPWIMDTDGQGLKITVPDYYSFNASDPQHLFPVSNPPTYDAGAGTAYYSSTGATTAATAAYQTIAYRYTNGVITRTDPWAPLVSNGKGGYLSAGAVTIVTTMTAFPTLTPDATIDTTGGTLRYNISFFSNYQPYAVQNDSDTIILHNVTFVRSKNLSN